MDNINLYDILNKLNDFIKHHYTENIKRGLQSGTHGYRHAQTVATISAYLAREFDEKGRIIVKIAALLHDSVRRPGDFGQENHAIDSAELAQKVLKKFALDSESINRVVIAIKEHSEKKWSNKLSEVLWSADKIEQISPFAPFRRAMFVGELIQAQKFQLGEPEIFDFFIKYFKKRIKITDSFPEIAAEITDEIPPYNRIFIEDLLNNGSDSWVWEMSRFAINRGRKNLEDIKAFLEYKNACLKFRNKQHHIEYIKLVDKYLDGFITNRIKLSYRYNFI